MKAWHRPLVALGLLAPACAPGQPQPAHKASPGPVAPLHPLIPSDEAPATSIPPTSEVASHAGESAQRGQGEGGNGSGAATHIAPVTTVTVSKLPPTTSGTTVSTYVLPEQVDESMGDIEWLIRQTFPETPDKAVRVARCESGLNPGAVSPTNDYGVMQVNIVHRGLAASMGYRWEQMLEVAPNLAVARAVYDDAGGWGPWTCAA